MSDKPPNPNVATARHIEHALARLGSLGLAVPEQCLPGVADNIALLERHWRILRGPNCR